MTAELLKVVDPGSRGAEAVFKSAPTALTQSSTTPEIIKPGRDPRDELPAPVLRSDILDMKDLKPGMELTGTVRNVIDFGAPSKAVSGW